MYIFEKIHETNNNTVGLLEKELDDSGTEV